MKPPVGPPPAPKAKVGAGAQKGKPVNKPAPKKKEEELM
jgi:hypothetical protein